MSTKLQWTTIDEDCDSILRKAPVPGGWLVQQTFFTYASSRLGAKAHSIAFVPDATHKWGSEPIAYEFDAWCDVVQKNIEKVTPHYSIKWEDLKQDYMAGLSPEGAAAKFLMK